jgi:hypothetical protein
MITEARDYSLSPETAWMKEQEPGQFYRLRLQWLQKSNRAMLEICLHPETRLSLEEEFKHLEQENPEDAYYALLDSMTHEERQIILRSAVGGYDLSRKEFEARMCEYDEEIGGDIGHAMFAGIKKTHE